MKSCARRNETLATVEIAAFTEQHIPSILAACGDWHELAQFGPPYWRPRSSAELRRKIASTSGPHMSTEYNFVITHNDRLVGECSLHSIDWRSRHAQVGICIWRPDDRRHGFGAAGTKILLDWARDDLDLHRLEAWIVDENPASCRLFTCLGFTHEGTLHSRYFHDGRHKSVRIYGRLLQQAE